MRLLIVGVIDLNKFQKISTVITSNEVVITNERIKHICDYHPGDYERFSEHFSEILLRPDFIIEANRAKSAVLLKKVNNEGDKIQLILRLNTSSDSRGYKNSIITFMRIRDKEWRRLINNKRIIYKSKRMC